LKGRRARKAARRRLDRRCADMETLIHDAIFIFKGNPPMALDPATYTAPRFLGAGDRLAGVCAKTDSSRTRSRPWWTMYCPARGQERESLEQAACARSRRRIGKGKAVVGRSAGAHPHSGHGTQQCPGWRVFALRRTKKMACGRGRWGKRPLASPLKRSAQKRVNAPTRGRGCQRDLLAYSRSQRARGKRNAR